jgi:hypothetical protein
MTGSRKALRVGALRAVVEFEGNEGMIANNVVANFLDGRGHDRSGVERVTKFEVHAATYVLQLEHGPSPGRAGDGDLHGLRAELGMAGKQRFATAEQHGCVAMVHGLDFEDGGRWKVVDENAAFDFRLDDAAVDFVSQVGVRVKHTG